MINFETQTLRNGLTVIAHTDPSTPMVTVNVLYKVGSRNENPERTGLAHLLEHLMFGGSRNAPQYDHHVQLAGGECNAFTTSDFTNYYITLPAQNVETALWLESDRMQHPLLTEQTLRAQKSVVIEEFHQRYLNQPYGDANLLLKPLAYKEHPYLWNTIGKSTAQIEQISRHDVQQFFDQYYSPHNAILVLAGNISAERAFALSAKWFDPVPSRPGAPCLLPPEPPQTESRRLEVKRNVPAPAIYKAYKMPPQLAKGYYACDLLSDILSNGKSSRLHRSLVQERGLFSQINAHIGGEMDAGLFTVSGYLLPATTVEQAEAAIEQQLQRLCTELVPEEELAKVKNKVESMRVFAEVAVSQRAVALACACMLGNPDFANTYIHHYRPLTAADLRTQAQQTFAANKSNTLVMAQNGRA